MLRGRSLLQPALRAPSAVEKKPATARLKAAGSSRLIAWPVRGCIHGPAFGWIAARGEGDAATRAREEAHLRLPLPVVGAELVHEGDRGPVRGSSW